MDFPLLIIPFLILIAFLYGSVGHGGASGYLAIFALWGLASPEVSATVLTMNIVVSGLALITYLQHRYFSLNILWPFLVTSIPASFLGAVYSAHAPAFEIVLGVVLILASLRFWLPVRSESPVFNAQALRVAGSLAGGAIIGFFSGMIGIGGGIFLSPLVLILGLADVRTTAGMAAAFVMLNSITGLGGHIFAGHFDWTWSILSVASVAVAGLAGAWSGASLITKPNLQKMLSMVMLIAGIKLLIS